MGLGKIANPKQLFGLALVIALLSIIACGSSATPTPVPADTAVPPTSAPPAPGDTVVPPTSTPRPVATATTAPVVSGPEVNPGKVTLMLQGWGNGRFDSIHANTGGGGSNYLRFMTALPIAGDENTNLLPSIITEWKASADGLSQIYTVDTDGIKFHDGSDMTFDDVFWTFKHNFDKACLEKCTNIGNPSLTQNIETMEQTGPDEITFTFEVPDAGFVFTGLSELGPTSLGIQPERPVLYDTALEEAYDKNPIMAGRMSFIEIVAAERISLERFDDYFYQPANGFPEDRRMKFQLLDILLVPEEATRAAALRAGDADIATVSLGTRDQVEAGGGRIIFGDQGVYFRTLFPQQYQCDCPFSDKNIRRALSYAFDKQLMMDQLYGGSEVAVAKGWAAVTPSTLGYSPDLDPLPFDPDRARQIIADAGYPNGEGFPKVIVNTWVSVGMPFLPESAQVAADFWRKELNLDVEVKVGDETSLKRAFRAGDLQGQILWRDNEARGDATGITRSGYGLAGADLRLHDDPELFALVQEAIAVFDPELRHQALNNVYKRLHDEHLEMAIGYVNIPWGTGPRIADWRPWPLAFYPSGLHTITLK